MPPSFTPSPSNSAGCKNVFYPACAEDDCLPQQKGPSMTPPDSWRDRHWSSESGDKTWFGWKQLINECEGMDFPSCVFGSQRDPPQIFSVPSVSETRFDEPPTTWDSYAPGPLTSESLEGFSLAKDKGKDMYFFLESLEDGPPVSDLPKIAPLLDIPSEQSEDHVLWPSPTPNPEPETFPSFYPQKDSRATPRDVEPDRVVSGRCEKRRKNKVQQLQRKCMELKEKNRALRAEAVDLMADALRVKEIVCIMFANDIPGELETWRLGTDRGEPKCELRVGHEIELQNEEENRSIREMGNRHHELAKGGFFYHTRDGGFCPARSRMES